MGSINKKNNSLSSSWEEEAFVDGKAAGGVLGGFVWPPRSYFCSFCKREFRSAQALGGHMNVHRRDRAKLKQSLIISPPPTTQVLHHHDQNYTSPTTTSFTAPPANSFYFSPSKLSSPRGANYEEPIMLNQELDCFVDKKFSVGIDLNEDIIRCKRHKKTAVSLLPPLLKKPCLVIEKSGNKVSPIMEDIDLELRLGVPPAVK
ncbi:hypothetical protein Leryth_002576 [Lithospermum erythrorhizon]|nr:hypothetical protein Leryth_002576 [Lithospermum erythrorhizon]